MDWLQFLSSIFSSAVSVWVALAWPAAAAAIVALLRGSTLLERLEGFEVPNWLRVSFVKTALAKTEKLLTEPEEAVSASAQGILPPDPDRSDPRQRVIKSWKKIEKYLSNRFHGEYEKADDKKYFIWSQTRMRVISPRTNGLLQNLLDIRTAADDLSEPITEQDAKRFEALTERVLALMEDPHEPYGGPPQHEPE